LNVNVVGVFPGIAVNVGVDIDVISCELGGGDEIMMYGGELFAGYGCEGTSDISCSLESTTMFVGSGASSTMAMFILDFIPHVKLFRQAIHKILKLNFACS
jgi:hypothetical protein